ncbi:MAG: chloride channel protein [Rhodobacterales bacterium]|nr:chloride channel protein [Rhodobacterales bacterium]
MKRLTPSRVLMWLRKIVRNDQLILSVLALVVGALGGAGVILFREGMDLVRMVAYGDTNQPFHLYLKTLPWWWLLLMPALGGLAVGLFLDRVMPGGRPQGVADVMEASALRGGRLSGRAGFGAAVASAASLGFGASVGREGPAVHLCATIGAWIAGRLHLTRSLSRTLVGCGAAAAVAGSFNAPIAGALFANEVVVGHYALSSFAPIVIASVTGTVITRGYFGDFPSFQLFEHHITSVLEFPAFIGVGILCGLAAILLVRGTARVQGLMNHVPGPGWIRPGVAGLGVGFIAIWFPEVLGDGYSVTNATLHGFMPLTLMLVLVAAKMVATMLSLGGGFAGGVFSPSLVIGALLGGAVGNLAAWVLPEMASVTAAYSLVGMGAVAAATLGAPISTTLIVFELTGDYALTMAVMVAVVVASVLTQQILGHSFFTQQLELRGVDLHRGFEAALLRANTVRKVMSGEAPVVAPETSLPSLRDQLQSTPIGELFVVGADGRLLGTITLADLSDAAFDHGVDDLVRAIDVARLHPPRLCLDDHLERALNIMRDSHEEHIAVVADHKTERFIGCVHERDVMAAYNRALVLARREEHQ